MELFGPKADSRDRLALLVEGVLVAGKSGKMAGNS